MPPVAAPGVASQEPCLSSLVRYAHRIKADGRSLAPGHAMGRRLFPQPARCRALRASNSLIMSSFVTCNDGMECSTAAIRIMLVREQLFIRSTLRVVLRIKDT